MEKGRVCVTGGTGFIASWLIMKLLQAGYSVNTTVRKDPAGDKKRDLSYLRNLAGASEKLKILNADLDEPESFSPAIEDCIGVFHVIHPMDWHEKEAESSKTERVMGGLLGILEACMPDEEAWTHMDFIRSSGRTALQFGQKHGLNVISLIPTWVHGPFFIPRCPDSVSVSLALILGNENYYKFLVKASLVHVDDVARTYIHLFEYLNARGRYIYSALEITIEQLSEFLSHKYPQFQMPTADSLKAIAPVKIGGLSSKKLQETGFKYEYGLEEMFDGAIQSCIEKGLTLLSSSSSSQHNL